VSTVEAKSGVLAVDADGHVGENGSAILEYMDYPHKEFRTGLANNGGLTPLDGQDRYLGRRLYRGPANKPEHWIEALDKGPLDWTVLYPSIGLFSGFIKDPDYQAAYSKAYNTWISQDFCAGSNGRIMGVALLPTYDPEEAEKELRRGASNGLVGGMFSADGSHLLGDKKFDCVYKAAEELNVSISIHASGSSLAPGAEIFPKFIQAHTVAHPYGILRQFTNMMFEGVFQKFPRTRFGFLEAGCTWLPWWLDRMDEEFQHRGEVDAPHLSFPPSNFVHQGGNIFFACEAGERLLEPVMNTLGDDIIMYASDYPHWDGTYPDSLKQLSDRPLLSKAQKYSVLRGSAERFYGLVAL